MIGKRALLLAVGIGSLPLLGQGWELDGQGVAGMGSAGAYTARAEDGSALYHNPAGMSFLNGTQFALSGGATLSRSFYSNVGQSTFDAEFSTAPLGSFYLTFPAGPLSFGLGGQLTHQNNLEWEEQDFPGRFLSTGSKVNVYEFIGGLSLKLAPKFSFGVTARMAEGQFDSYQNINRPTFPEGNQNPLFFEVRRENQLSGNDIGFSAGFMYKDGRRLAVGLNFRSKIEMDLDGDVTFALLTRTEDQRAIDAFESEFTNLTAESNIELPDRMDLAVTFKTSVRTRLAGQVSLTRWSTVNQTQLNYSNGQMEIIDRGWEDIYSVRIGADFQQKRALLWRAGLGTYRRVNPDATISPEFPDGDRFLYTFGVTCTVRPKWSLEAALAFVQNRDRDTTDQEFLPSLQEPNYIQPFPQQGTYETQRWHLKAGLKYIF